MKAGAKTIEKDFNDLIDYVEKFCKGANITITVDRNPSPEKIARIRETIRLTNERRNIHLAITE